MTFDFLCCCQWLTNPQILKDATLHVSHHGITANLAMVMPVMDIDNEFTAIANQTNCTWHLSICTAVALRKETLNKYYLLTGKSDHY
jgi:hypothetical protein